MITNADFSRLAKALGAVNPSETLRLIPGAALSLPAHLFLARIFDDNFSTNTAPGAGTTLNSRVAGEDGFYHIIASASLANAVAAIQPILFRITDELPGVLYEEEQSLEETTQLNARWEHLFWLRKDWAVRLINRTAFGVGETIETEINLMRLLL